MISTNRGYIFTAPHTVSRIFKVHHTDADLENELCGIVDLGGKVINVMVNHRVYGHIEAELNISSRRQVENFMEDIRSGKSSPLKNITSDYHYHKVEARIRGNPGYDPGYAETTRISDRSRIAEVRYKKKRYTE